MQPTSKPFVTKHSSTLTSWFAYMRPSSPYIHLVHSAATFSLPSSDDHYRGKDIAFVGDPTDCCVPTLVKLAQIQPRTWIAKKIVLDCAAFEEFYANPDNKNKLFHSTDCMGEENVTLPQMLALPPDFVHFCVDTPKTPFQLHNCIRTYATADNPPIAIADCESLLDWCVMASHHDTVPTTSILAL